MLTTRSDAYGPFAVGMSMGMVKLVAAMLEYKASMGHKYRECVPISFAGKQNE